MKNLSLLLKTALKMNPQAEKIIQQLGLTQHPEGGYFKEIYRSEEQIPKSALPDYFSGPRNYATGIYFLLTSDTFSAFHRINQDEAWHFYQGSTIELHMISPQGEHSIHLIGHDLEAGEQPQFIVPKHYWFAAKVLGENAFAFVGCTVAPGFDFNDFELAKREELTALFPEHEAVIKDYTRV